MAGRGFSPSGRAQKASRNAVRAVVKSDGKIGGYPLPPGVLGTTTDGEPIPWHGRTIAWWESWRASPQGVRMATDVDWDFLLDTARMHHEFWTHGRWEVAAELRLRVSKFGATPEDRARLRFEIEVDEQYPAGTPHTDPTTTRADARRDRLMADSHGGNVTAISPNL